MEWSFRPIFRGRHWCVFHANESRYIFCSSKNDDNEIDGFFPDSSLKSGEESGIFFDDVIENHGYQFSELTKFFIKIMNAALESVNVFLPK